MVKPSRVDLTILPVQTHQDDGQCQCKVTTPEEELSSVKSRTKFLGV